MDNEQEKEIHTHMYTVVKLSNYSILKAILGKEKENEIHTHMYAVVKLSNVARLACSTGCIDGLREDAMHTHTHIYTYIYMDCERM